MNFHELENKQSCEILCRVIITYHRMKYFIFRYGCVWAAKGINTWRPSYFFWLHSTLIKWNFVLYLCRTSWWNKLWCTSLMKACQMTRSIFFSFLFLWLLFWQRAHAHTHTTYLTQLWHNDHKLKFVCARVRITRVYEDTQVITCGCCSHIEYSMPLTI